MVQEPKPHKPKAKDMAHEPIVLTVGLATHCARKMTVAGNIHLPRTPPVLNLG